MLQTGTIVSGYRVDGVLGDGGMGTVYRATQLSLNRVVALKLLAPEFGDDPGFRSRFEREGQLQAGLDHQHIVPVYEAGQSEHGLFLAMRLIDGPTLKDVIISNQINPRRALRILAQVAQALDEAHDAGLIHRDIKPQNILIDRGDHAYLADFGLIKAPDEAHLTGTGQFLGTIDYVAPEQVQGDPATAASDCYSLTAVLYECLTGEVPFPKPNEAATLHAQVVEAPPKPSDKRPELPAAIDEVIAKGMSKDPAERPRSATDLIRSAALALASASAAAAGAAQETRIAQHPADRSQSTRVPAVGPAPIGPAPAGPAPAGPAPAAPASVGPGGAGPAPAAPSTRAAAVTRAQEAPRERSRWLGPAIIGLLAVVAIAAGFLVGHSGKKQQASGEKLGSSAAAGHLQLRYPSSWRLNAAAPSIPGITFRDAIVLSAPAPRAGTLTAGEVTDATGPSLLAPGFAKLIQGGAPSGRPVKIGGTEALSFPGLRVSGHDGTISLIAVPTSDGVATVACSASSARAAAFQTDCARVAGTLKLMGTTPFALGPNADYARALSSALSSLRASSTRPLAALHAAKTPSAQASAALQLAGAYAKAADSLQRLDVSPADLRAHQALIAAVDRLASGYRSAAKAAHEINGRAYQRAAGEIASGASALRAALRALSVLGYRVNTT